MLKIKNILHAGNLFCWVPDIAASQTTCTPGPLLPRDVAGQREPRLKIKLPEWCPSLVSFRFGLRPNRSSTKPQGWHGMVRHGTGWHGMAWHGVDCRMWCLEQGAGAQWPRDPQSSCCSRAPQHLSPAAEARTRWEESVGAPANINPLQPKSALPRHRRLLLVLSHGERCKDHEPFRHPKRDVRTRDPACGRGRHPLTPHRWEKGPRVGVARHSSTHPAPAPPSRPPSPRHPGLLRASTGRISLCS